MLLDATKFLKFFFQGPYPAVGAKSTAMSYIREHA